MADPECLHDIGSPNGYLRLRHLAHWWHPEEAGHGRLCGCKQVSTRPDWSRLRQNMGGKHIVFLNLAGI